MLHAVHCASGRSRRGGSRASTRAPPLAMPGVRAIAIGGGRAGPDGVGIADHPLFAREHVRYDGEPIAAVAADTLEQAQRRRRGDRRRDSSRCRR